MSLLALILCVSFSTGHGNDEDIELVRALKQVLDDDSFKVKAPATTAARKVQMSCLTQWCLDLKNTRVLKDFTKQL